MQRIARVIVTKEDAVCQVMFRTSPDSFNIPFPFLANIAFSFLLTLSTTSPMLFIRDLLSPSPLSAGPTSMAGETIGEYIDNSTINTDLKGK